MTNADGARVCEGCAADYTACYECGQLHLDSNLHWVGSSPTLRQTRRVTTLDWCRHCEIEGAMTVEHLPPKSTGNDEPINLIDDAGRILRTFSEGHALPVLCDGCNNGASRRGLPAAYKLWREDTVRGIGAATASARGGRSFNIWRTSLTVDVDHNYALHPGRVVRQVLGMLLAVQSRPRLLAEHPQLREAYFSEDEASIEPLTLHVALANTGYGYFTDVVSAITMNLVDATAETMDMRLVCFTPFLATLVHGPAPPWRSTRIDHWLGHSTNYHFRKRNRRISYPIADRSHPAVAMLYGNSDI